MGSNIFPVGPTFFRGSGSPIVYSYGYLYNLWFSGEGGLDPQSPFRIRALDTKDRLWPKQAWHVFLFMQQALKQALKMLLEQKKVITQVLIWQYKQFETSLQYALIKLGRTGAYAHVIRR